MFHHAGQVDRSLDARVAAADHRHVLALEQRPVAAGAVGHALGAVFVLAGHADVAPARAGGQDDGAALQLATVVQLHRHQATRLRGGHQLGRALGVHHVDVVVGHVRSQLGRVFGASGVGHAGVVVDVQRVVDLAAKAVGHDAGAQALARGVDGRRRAGRAAADHQHLVGRLGAELGGVALGGAGVDLLQDFFERDAAAVEHLAALIDGGHAHDLARFNFLLEHAAIDDGGLDARVVDADERQRLHHVRAVVAGQAHVDLEVQVHVERLDLLEHLGLDLGRVAAGPQQGQDQRGELVPHGDGGKGELRAAARPRQGERGHARVAAVGAQPDLVRTRGRHLLQQLAQLGGFGVVAQGRHHLERLLHALEVGRELLLDVLVQHGGCSLSDSCSRLLDKRWMPIWSIKSRTAGPAGPVAVRRGLEA